MKIATLCFPVEDDFIYLANKKRGFGAGFLNGYGGKANEGEDVVSAACREFEEESGVKISAVSAELVGIINFYEEEKHLFECHVFFIKNWEGEFTETEEMALPEKFSRDNLPFDRMWKSDRVWLPILCNGEKIIAKAVYKEGMKEAESFKYKSLAY